MTSRRPTVVLVGTVDPRGPGHALVRDRLLEAGVDVTVVGVGIPGEPGFKPDVPAATLARAGGGPPARGGCSKYEQPGGPDVDPEADAAMSEAIRATLRPGVPCREIDANINEPALADAATATFLELWAVRRPSPAPREA